MNHTQYIINGKFLFDSENYHLCLLDGSQTLTLGNNEGKALCYLIEHAGEIVTREVLQQKIWRDMGLEVDDSSLTQAISNLRKQLDDPSKSPVYIRTVPKQGYKFIAALETPSREPSPVKKPNYRKPAVISALILFVASLLISQYQNTGLKLEDFKTQQLGSIKYHLYGENIKQLDLQMFNNCLESFKARLAVNQLNNIAIYQTPQGNWSISLMLLTDAKVNNKTMFLGGQQPSQWECQ